MSAFISEFTKDAERAGEILEVFARHGFAQKAAHHSGINTSRHGTDERSAGQRLAAALTELGTTWIKYGQSLSMRPDIVGAETASELGALQASVPADAPGLARARVERELGQPVTDLFASFEDEPFGSGSVAQVHKAILHDGTSVVVKVLHDGAQETVIRDLSLMQRLAQYAVRVDPELEQFDPIGVIEQFSKMMNDAVNLQRELANMQRLSNTLADHDWLLVPRAFESLSTSQVLTMEHMSGESIDGEAAVRRAGWDPNELTSGVTDAWLTMIFGNGFYHADPHLGNFLVADSEHVVLLDFGDVGFISGPHRESVARILLGLATADIPFLTDTVLDASNARATADADELEGAVEEWLANYLPKSAGSDELDLKAAMNAGALLLRRFNLRLPPDITSLLNVIVRLEGFGRSIGATMPFDEQIEPFVKRYIRGENSPRNRLKRTFREFAEWQNLAHDLPRDISKVLARLRRGDTRVDVNIHDSDGMADKIVDGLVASTSLLGAAQLLSRGAPPQVKGVSVLGAANALLAVVTLHRITSKRSEYKTVEQRVVSALKRFRR